MLKLVEPIYIRLGNRVRELREMKGWTQSELSEMVGLTRTSIVNFENGRQRILLHDVATFAKAFKVSEDALLRNLWKGS